jgi:hypothetical protein
MVHQNRNDENRRENNSYTEETDQNRDETVAEKTTPETWTEYVKHFVLNGLFREQKVIFKEKELEYKGAIFNRIAFHFNKGMKNRESRVNLDEYDSEEVETWWMKHGAPMVHKKLMEKKSNQMSEIRKSIYSK